MTDATAAVVSSLTHADTEAAFRYASEKLRQTELVSLKRQDPHRYAFITVKDLGVQGWKKHSRNIGRTSPKISNVL